MRTPRPGAALLVTALVLPLPLIRTTLILPPLLGATLTLLLLRALRPVLARPAVERRPPAALVASLVALALGARSFGALALRTLAFRRAPFGTPAPAASTPAATAPAAFAARASTTARPAGSSTPSACRRRSTVAERHDRNPSIKFSSTNGGDTLPLSASAASSVSLMAFRSDAEVRSPSSCPANSARAGETRPAPSPSR